MRLLGRYTAYYSCEMQNPIDQYNLSDQEKECIEGSIFVSKDCSELNKKNADVIKAIELQEINKKKHTTNNFINSIKTEFYDQIEKFEQVAEDKRINKQIQKHITICKNYTFDEGSKEFHQCILTLIELDKKIEYNIK